jgi:hypothetical protein
VISCVVPSLKLPVATNCCVVLAAAVGDTGVIETETSVPVPMVRVVVPDIPDDDAVIVTVPPFLPCAIPLDRIEARFGLEDFHEIPVRFDDVLPSLKVPVALNLITVPLAILGFAGAIVIDTR